MFTIHDHPDYPDYDWLDEAPSPAAPVATLTRGSGDIGGAGDDTLATFLDAFLFSMMRVTLKSGRSLGVVHPDAIICGDGEPDTYVQFRHHDGNECELIEVGEIQTIEVL